MKSKFKKGQKVWVVMIYDGFANSSLRGVKEGKFVGVTRQGECCIELDKVGIIIVDYDTVYDNEKAALRNAASRLVIIESKLDSLQSEVDLIKKKIPVIYTVRALQEEISKRVDRLYTCTAVLAILLLISTIVAYAK